LAIQLYRIKLTRKLQEQVQRTSGGVAGSIKNGVQFKEPRGRWSQDDQDEAVPRAKLGRMSTGNECLHK